MTFDPNIINKTYVLSDDQGDSRVAQNMYIIAHESGSKYDEDDPKALLHEVQNEKNNYNGENPYVHFFVGYMDGKAQVFQIGEPGYVAWGALDANPYAPVQVEFAHVYQNDQGAFSETYKLYVELIRYYADKYGIPKQVDMGTIGTKGVKSHLWVTENYGGTHTDPYDYFYKMGVSKEKFVNDIANGISGGNSSNSSKPQAMPKRNVITIKNAPVTGVNAWKKDGTMINGSSDTFKNGTSWQSAKLIKVAGIPMYQVATDEYIPKKYTDQAGIVTINAIKGVPSFTGNFEDTGKRYSDYSAWKTSDTDFLVDTEGKVQQDQVFFKIATDQYINGYYTIGGGNK